MGLAVAVADFKRGRRRRPEEMINWDKCPRPRGFIMITYCPEGPEPWPDTDRRTIGGLLPPHHRTAPQPHRLHTSGNTAAIPSSEQPDPDRRCSPEKDGTLCSKAYRMDVLHRHHRTSLLRTAFSVPVEREHRP